MKTTAKKKEVEKKERAICIYCGKRKVTSKFISIVKNNSKYKDIYLCYMDCYYTFRNKLRLAENNLK